MDQSVIEAPATAHHRREGLITRTSRLAFEVEAAEREGSRITLVRLRIDYHQAMAELLAATSSWCLDGERQVARARADHLDVLAGYRAELARLEAGI